VIRTALIALAMIANVAHADDVTGIVFVTQPVRAPVAPDRVMPVAPFVPSGTAEQTGAIALGSERAAALWLDALDVVRVRTIDGAGKLRFARVAGGVSSRARIDEPGIAIDASTHYLTQPPGGGDTWMIWADGAATVRIERAIARDGRAIWESTQRALLAWVDRGGARPAIPITDGAHVAALSFDADAAVGAAIEAADSSLRDAVRAWRKANIVAELTAIRPLVTPQLKVEQLELDGMSGTITVPDPTVPEPRPYKRIDRARTYELELEGPGALHVDARAVLPHPRGGVSNAPGFPDVSLSVVANGRVLASRTVAATYATAPDLSTPPPAFPAKLPLVAREGEALGERVAIAIPLFPGKHTYRIALEGGTLAVRAAVGRRRVRVVEALGADDVDEFVDDARDAIRSKSAPAELLRALIAQRAGAPARMAKTPEGLPPALAGAWLAVAGNPRDFATAKLAKTPHAWVTALAIARRLDDGDAVRALYDSLAGSPPASLVPELVSLLPRSTPLERMRNWSLAATLLAARARPTDAGVIAATRARWRTGEWMQLPPAFEAKDEEAPAPQRWLVEATPQPLAAPRAWRTGDLVRIAPNKPRTVTALPSPLDPARAALLDVFVSASEAAPIEVNVDGVKLHVLALAGVERVQVAVAPGKHQVSISGPPSLRGWVSSLPAAAVDAGDRARVQSLWPASVDGAPLRYTLPGGDLPIEVTLRSTGKSALGVTLRSDVGAPIPLTIAAGSRDAKAHALDRAPELGEEVRFVVWPANGARVVWLETEHPERVFASIAARRERSLVAPQPSKPGAAVDLLDRVARSSRALATDPDDAVARASRANDLLDLGETSLAREDLVRLLAVPAAKKQGTSVLEEELFARLETAAEPTHVALANGMAASGMAPVLVAPALAAVASQASLAEKRDAAAALRAGRFDEAIKLAGNDSTGAAIAARAYAMRGDSIAAARALVGVYAQTDRWPIALEALDYLTRSIGDRKATPPAGLVALTYGIAARVRVAIDHPRARRALAVSAAQSGWDTLTAMSTSAGHEMMLSTRPILPPAPSVLVREALLAPAWSARSAHTLTPGNAAVLDIQLPAGANVHAQIHCVRMRSAELSKTEAAAPCALTSRIDNGATKSISAFPGTTANIALDAGAGRHVIEIALAGEGDAASVRFTSDKPLPDVTDPIEAGGLYPIRIERRTKLFVASASTPVGATVHGPTTIWVQARSREAARTAEVIATPASGAPVRAVIALSADRDADARGDGRTLTLSPPSDTFLVLPEATTYQIAVRPDRGEAVARIALRDERKSKPARVTGPWYAAAPLARPPFAMVLAPAVIDAPTVDEAAIGRSGTFSFEARIEQDARGDEDVESTTIGGLVETGVTFRRALVPRRAWFAARGAVRGRQDTAAIGNVSAELSLDQLPLGTTIEVAGGAYTQDFSDGRAWHVRGRARLGWRWALTDTLNVRPTLGFASSYLNTTPELVAVTDDKIDPDVYNQYRYDHRREANSGLSLYWMPFQDFVGHIDARSTSNRDLGSLDHAGVGVGFRTLAPLPLLGETLITAAYRPNYRFADDHRPSAYWRHDLTARLEWSVWTTPNGRFVLSLWDEFYPGTRNAFGAALRFDLVRRRGLTDFAPSDAPFASLVDDRDYVPLEAP
jgi:hypothetical protein